MKVQWLTGFSPNKVRVCQATYDRYSLPVKLIIHFGAWRREFTVEIGDNLPNDTLGVSEKIFDNFSIPESLEYEHRLTGRNLHLGPVIGICLYSSRKAFTDERFVKLEDYLTDYSLLKGLIFVCSLDGFDLESKTIAGYYYDPSNPTRPWVSAKLPYPAALYRKTGMSRRIYDDLISVIGDKVFNTYFFDKWELWEELSAIDDIRLHLPYTERVSSLEALDRMLATFGSVYLKQESGEKARGIIKVEKDGADYLFSYRFREQKRFGETSKLQQFLQELGNKHYLMQQGLNMPRYENRNIDFRVIMQKNYHQQWQASGIIARFGKKNSVVTNFLLAGYAKEGTEALELAYGLDKRQAFLVREEIVHVCQTACRHLEQRLGHYGDLGIDVIVDNHLHVWILEINKLHDHGFPLYAIDDQLMYYRVVTTPLAYAKALAGF